MRNHEAGVSQQNLDLFDQLKELRRQIAKLDAKEYPDFRARVTTTDGTVTTLHAFTLPASTTYAVEAHVVARRTGGVSGTAEDGAWYILRAVYKNAAGTATIIGSVSQTVIGESQAGWDATLDTTGGTVRVRVTGASNNNIVWEVTARVRSVSA